MNDFAPPSLFNDPFGRCSTGSKADLGLTREDRVRLLGEAAHALARNEMPSDAARKFLADGLLNWLEQGGSLTRDHFRTSGPQGSTATEARIWAHMIELFEKSDI